jgi:O-antigen/teichoic acid export membrane protein
VSNLGRTLIRNSLSGAVAYGVDLAVNLLLAPYLLSTLGAELFGIWIVLVVATNYFSLFDLGVSTGFIKHLTEAETHKRINQRNTIVATGWVFYALFSLLIIGIGTTAGGWLLRFLKVDPTFTTVYWGVLLVFGIRNSSVVYRSLLFARQRVDVLNAIAVAGALIRAIGTVAALALGYGLAGLVTVSIGMALFHVTLEVLMAYRIYDRLRLRPLAASFSTFLTLFQYGIRVQTSRFADLVYLHIDKLLLSHFVGFGAVTFYELGGKVAGLTRSFPTILLQGLLPAAAELEAQRNRARLLRLYVKSSKYLAALAFPLAAFSILEARQIIQVWLGAGDHGAAALALQALTIAYLFHLLMEVALAVARGIGVVQYEMRALLVTAVLNLALSLLLIIQYGLTGALIGTTVSMVIGYALFMWPFHRYVAFSFGDLVKDVYLVPFAGAAVASVAVAAAGYSFGWLEPSVDAPRLVGLLSLSCKGLLFVALYGAMVWKRGYIAVSDMHLLRRTVLSSS